MAHLISEVSGRAEVFTAGQRPWHGLGVNVPDLVASAEALQHAGLDWEVRQAEVKFEAAQNTYAAPDRVVNYRWSEDGNAVYLGTVSKQYRIIQNRDAFDFFDDVIGRKEAIYESAGAIRNGKRVWILAKLNRDMVVRTPGGEDVVEKYLLLTNGHDGAFGCRMFFTPIRVVCNNTLTAALRDASTGIFIAHRGNIKNKVEEAVRTLNIANKFYSSMGDVFQQMAEFPVTKKMAQKYFNDIIPIGKLEGKAKSNAVFTRDLMMENFEHGAGSTLAADTLWGAYNAVSQYADHQRFMFHPSRSEHGKFESVVWGDSAQIKGRAFEYANALLTSGS